MTKRDTYGVEINGGQPEWKSFQQRNRDIEAAAERVRAAAGSRCQNVEFFSEGTRCRGTLWFPKQSIQDKPMILLCHGLGGLRAFLDVRYASKFADEGFHVMTFDYRGWGTSDGVIVPLTLAGDESVSKSQNDARIQDLTNQEPVMANVKARIVRQTLNMEHQLADIDAALSYLSTMKLGKVGIWGSSQGGGHVLEIGARNPDLVSCIVSQVPSVGKNGIGNIPEIKNAILESRQKAALTGWIPSGAREYHWPAVDGSPILRSFEYYDPLLSCHQIVAPTLIIDVENEELWDVKQNGKAAFDLITSPKQYFVLKNANHYDAYSKASSEARLVTVQFFKRYLVGNGNVDRTIHKL